MKEAYGFNGEHAMLGREIKEAEFRGYVVRALEDISTDIKEFKSKEQKFVDRLKPLEETRAQLLLIAALIASVMSLVAPRVVAAIMGG